jgi:hypothetical protein
MRALFILLTVLFYVYLLPRHPHFQRLGNMHGWVPQHAQPKMLVCGFEWGEEQTNLEGCAKNKDTK